MRDISPAEKKRNAGKRDISCGKKRNAGRGISPAGKKRNAGRQDIACEKRLCLVEYLQLSTRGFVAASFSKAPWIMVFQDSSVYLSPSRAASVDLHERPSLFRILPDTD